MQAIGILRSTPPEYKGESGTDQWGRARLSGYATTSHSTAAAIQSVRFQNGFGGASVTAGTVAEDASDTWPPR